MRLRLTILIALVVFFAAVTVLFITGYFGSGGATTGSGHEPLDTDQFVTAYVELAQLAESMAIGTPEYDKERERILGAIGIKPSQVEQTLSYYNEHPDLWRPIWEEIQTRLASQLEAVNRPGQMDTVKVGETP